MISKVRIQGEKVRRAILDSVAEHAGDLAAHVADKFGITRQGVNKHLQRLQQQGVLLRDGTSRKPIYRLATLEGFSKFYELSPALTEDAVWTQDIRPNLGELPDNIFRLWHHGFTEMFNNAIDHSAGTRIYVHIARTAAYTEILINDNGIGIFKKIQHELDLLDERYAIFELAKGKLTTDPSKHSGQGIFFTSRMFDSFGILSNNLHFNHDIEHRLDWLQEYDGRGAGTTVFMLLSNHTSRTTKKVFDSFSGGEDYSFNKTVVPVRLAKYNQDELVSRSQAKRFLARVELFENVIIDFEGVQSIGQAFADQIFRVFANDHPKITLDPIRMSKEVSEMVNRAIALRAEGDAPPT